MARPIKLESGAKVPGATVDEVEAFLIEQGCTIVEYGTFLSNPNQAIVSAANYENWKNFMIAYCKVYTKVFVFKKKSNGTQYMTLNNYFGVMITV